MNSPRKPWTTRAASTEHNEVDLGPNHLLVETRLESSIQQRDSALLSRTIRTIRQGIRRIKVHDTSFDLCDLDHAMLFNLDISA